MSATCPTCGSKVATTRGRADLESDPAFRKLLRHALGLDSSKVEYRNHYCVVEGSENGKRWEVLCLVGYATRGELSSGNRTYFVTDQGRAWLRGGR